MAALKKHGKHIIIDYIWSRVAVCEDGKILRNMGDGWKIYRTCKSDSSYEAVAANRQKCLDIVYREHQELFAFKQLVDELCPSYRGRMFLRTGLQMLGDDPDGLYIELQDSRHGLELSLDDVIKLCRAYALVVGRRVTASQCEV